MRYREVLEREDEAEGAEVYLGDDGGHSGEDWYAAVWDLYC